MTAHRGAFSKREKEPRPRVFHDPGLPSGVFGDPAEVERRIERHGDGPREKGSHERGEESSTRGKHDRDGLGPANAPLVESPGNGEGVAIELAKGERVRITRAFALEENVGHVRLRLRAPQKHFAQSRGRLRRLEVASSKTVHVDDRFTLDELCARGEGRDQIPHRLRAAEAALTSLHAEAALEAGEELHALEASETEITLE